MKDHRNVNLMREILFRNLSPFRIMPFESYIALSIGVTACVMGPTVFITTQSVDRREHGNVELVDRLNKQLEQMLCNDCYYG